MLNQTATEALLSATYVENYLDCVENLPNDLQRHLSRMRELDVTYRECVRDAESYLALCIAPHTEEKRRQRAAIRLQTSLVTAQEIGDEKLQVVQVLQDLIDNKQRGLDGDHKKLVTCLDVNTNGGTSKKDPSPPAEPVRLEKEATTPPEQQTPTPPPPERTVEKEKDKSERDKSGGERWSKRARRSRNNAGGNTDGADSSERDSERVTNNHTHKKGIGKKKKRKARQAAQRSETPPEETDAIDPDEPRYCLCDQISFGEMILCDNDLCPIEWFHFSCVSLTTKPKGKWFCPKCRGDRPNVMKPKGQFLKELERYNREKEEKA
ncbi:inhibitor of growth protein 1 isoform X2 [Pectinophora gossypiella]|uniref:inhibitor of growth protein 1 isoform X2 n=1 Tax=Pectinophora gossypiella TaxID=13191 RepID=UPI00214EC62B|nr:inhibitor of growth protein 1 isoform X2 [Pectinophora gossypiella]